MNKNIIISCLTILLIYVIIELQKAQKSTRDCDAYYQTELENSRGE